MAQKHTRGVVLKPGREQPILRRHHWIFSGGIAQMPDYEPGDILPVYSHSGQFLGNAYFNPYSDIAGRMMSFFEDRRPAEVINAAISRAIQLRSSLFDQKKTNSFRLINGEADELPGLIVDQYDKTLVVQVSTTGMDKLKPYVVEELLAQVNPITIFERSDIPSRLKERLPQTTGLLAGADPVPVEVLENGIKFLVDVVAGHKTGYYLDQREMRDLVGTLSKDRRVLNCFSYTGGFSLYAAQGGALTTTSVDLSGPAIELAKQNFAINNLSGENNFVVADVFKFLREDPLDFDLIVLDPPAFAKKRNDVDAALRGYRDINRLALTKMPPGSILVTCSCSYHVDREMFEKVVQQAAAEANRSVKIIHRHRLAFDHAINLHQSESDYLKSLVLWVD